MFFYILKVCFIAKADNSTFHVLELKNTGLIFVISSDDSRCLTNVVVVIIDYGCDCTQYTELFPHHVKLNNLKLINTKFIQTT